MALAEVYDRYVEHKRSEYSQGFQGRRFRASALGSCPRQQMMTRTGWPKQEMSLGSRRMLHDRSVVHNEHVQAWEWVGIAVATEHRMTHRFRTGAPSEGVRGYAGQFDALLHVDCCDLPIRNLRTAWSVVTRYRDTMPRVALEAVKELRKHRLTLVDAKTVHPNIVNFTDSLPKEPHLKQLTYYAMSLHDDPGLDVHTMLSYIPIGGQTAEIECPFDWNDYEGSVTAEMEAMDLWWRRWKRDKRHGVAFIDRTLPPVIELVWKKPDKEGRLRLVQAWDCGYCDFAARSCFPRTTVYQGGDWLATVQSGSVVVLRSDKNLRGYNAVDVELRLNEAGYQVVPEAVERVQ